MRDRIAYDQFSASRLTTLLTCPLQFDFVYVRRHEVPQNIWKVFGVVMHRYFEEFFTKRWQRRESFVKSALHFWGGVVNDEHGPDGFGDAPVKLAWGNLPAEKRGMFFGKTRGILGRFWDRNIEYRTGRKPAPKVEIGFKFRSNGVLVNGWLDRIQPLEAGDPREVPAEIWDYKPSAFSPLEAVTDLQFTIYAMAFRALYGRDPVALRVFSYNAEGDNYLQELPARTPAHFAQLDEFFFEARTYVEAMMRGRKPSTPTVFRYFNVEDITSGQCSARPPVGKGAHCHRCEYQEYCRAAHVEGIVPTREFLAQIRHPVSEKQLALPLFSPRGTDRETTLFAEMERRAARRPGVTQLGWPEFIAKPTRTSKPRPKKTKQAEGAPPTAVGENTATQTPPEDDVPF